MKAEAIQEFAEIYEKEFGVKLSYSEANIKASKFLKLFNRVTIAREKENKKGDDTNVRTRKKRAQHS